MTLKTDTLKYIKYLQIHIFKQIKGRVSMSKKNS